MGRYIILYLISVVSSQFLIAKGGGVEPAVLSSFEIGKQQVESGAYDAAIETFRHLLTPQKLLPDELAFYFGKSLYHEGNHKHVAIDFLKKYLILRGDTARYYDETMTMLKAMGEYKEKQTKDKSKDTRTSAQKQLDKCKENTHTVCPICNGKNTLVSPTAFGSSFRECNYCDERGLMPCNNYSKYINEGVLLEYKKQ